MCDPETVQKIDTIIKAVSEGSTLKSAAAEQGIRLQMFHQVISSVRELGVAYARARELQADVLVEEAIAAADNADIDPSRARNMIDIRRWAASKYNQRVYGDRVDLNVTQSISINEALTEARSRVLPLQVPKVIELTPAEGEPDIFS